MAVAGLSTLGITFGYALETTAGTKPTKFTQLTRINEIGEVTVEPESIDASALEDKQTRNIAGRDTVSDTMTVTVNKTNDTIEEWNAVIDAYNNRSNTDLRMWFETITPGFDEAEFVVAQPPSILPISAKSQNELQTMEINLIIEEMKGMDAKVDFS